MTITPTEECSNPTCYCHNARAKAKLWRTAFAYQSRNQWPRWLDIVLAIGAVIAALTFWLMALCHVGWFAQ